MKGRKTMLFLMTVYGTKTAEETILLEDLIGKIALGNNDAFREFYETTKADIYSFSLSILKNKFDAEDVMQSVYIKVYNSADGYKPNGKPMAWVLTITKNLCHDKLRSNSKQSEFTTIEENDASIADSMQADDKMLLEYCLARLNEKERNIVVLHIVSGLKHREIAEFLKIPEGTVQSKYNRALAKIKSFLERGGI
jgi:RNA polymerase sigma-70 factor (ECF subfamily)